MKGHDWASFPLPGIRQKDNKEKETKCMTPGTPHTLKGDGIPSLGRSEKAPSRGQWEDRYELKTRSVQFIRATKLFSLVFSICRISTRGIQTAWKCHLTKTCTASEERSKTLMVSLSHRWGSRCTEVSAGFRNDWVSMELLTHTYKASVRGGTKLTSFWLCTWC